MSISNALKLDCQLTCGKCDRYPCGLLGDVKYEVNKLAKQLNDSSEEIINSLRSLSRPDVTPFFTDLETMLKDHPISQGEGIDKIGVSTIDELTRLFGLPHDNDKERLAALGIGVISHVAWKLDDTNNFAYYRTLYLALGRDYNKLTACLNGEYGNWFVVYTQPSLVKVISPSSRHLTLQEIIDQLGYSIQREDVLQVTDSNGLKISLVYKESFLGLNEPLQLVANASGISKEEVMVKVFNLGTAFTNYDLMRLRSFGLSDEQIGWIQAPADKSQVATKLGELKKYLTPGITSASLSAARLGTLKLIVEYGYVTIPLSKALYTKLRTKLTDSEIQMGLEEPWISGISHTLTDNDLRLALEETATVEPGTHYISNRLLSQPVNQYKSVLLRLLNIYSLLLIITPGTDATFIADLIPEAQAQILTEPTPVTPENTSKSYDSGASLIERLVSMDKTFQINATLNATLTGVTIPSISTQAIAGVLAAGYNSAFKAINELNSGANQAIRDLEKLTSVGLTMTGVGVFDSSFLKCAAGIDFDFNYNPLRDLVNQAIDALNAFVDSISQLLQKLLKDIICKIKCMQEALGLAGLNANLPFCSLSIPPLVDLDPALNELAKYGSLLNNLVLQRMSGQNVLRFALTDMHSSFNDVGENACGCQPLGGIFGMLRTVVPLAQLGVGLASGAPTLSGSGASSILPTTPKF